MVRISYTKVENIFTETLRKIRIDRLAELAAMVNLIRDPNAQKSPKVLEEIYTRFQTELKRLKEHDAKLFESLNLTARQEKKFLGKFNELSLKDWVKLKAVCERIDELKRELYGHEAQDKTAYELQVEKERARHINKRFNIREGWIPLH